MNQSNQHLIYIDDYPIAYVQQGEGSPVILIHGIPTPYDTLGHEPDFMVNNFDEFANRLLART